MMKRILIPAIVVSVGIGASLILTQTEKNTPESLAETSADVPSGPAAPASVVTVAEPAAGVTLQVEAPKIAEVPKAWAEFKHQVDLEKYLGLRKKVLLAEGQNDDKKDLLNDRALLQSLQPLLVTEAPADKVELQNAALDLLFEALKTDMRAEAIEVFKSVVADSFIESQNGSFAARENLAGIKAEVLLNWSSADPGASAEIEASLPGPVSQKIWDNVKKHQKNNLAESATLQARK